MLNRYTSPLLSGTEESRRYPSSGAAAAVVNKITPRLAASKAAHAGLLDGNRNNIADLMNGDAGTRIANLRTRHNLERDISIDTAELAAAREAAVPFYTAVGRTALRGMVEVVAPGDAAPAGPAPAELHPAARQLAAAVMQRTVVVG